jgi:hypothetical protein
MAYVKVRTSAGLPPSDAPDLVVWVDKHSLQTAQESNRSVTRWNAVEPGVYLIPRLLLGERIILWLDRSEGLELLKEMNGMWFVGNSWRSTIDDDEYLLIASIEDPSGVPLSGIVVQLSLTEFGSPIGVSTTTGDDGMFTFDHLKYGDWWIQVDDPRFAPIKTTFGLTPSKYRDDRSMLGSARLQPAKEQILDFVKTNGEPASGIVLNYGWDNQGQPNFTAFQSTTNDAGRAILRAPTDAELWLDAEFGFGEAIHLNFYPSDTPLVVRLVE